MDGTAVLFQVLPWSEADRDTPMAAWVEAHVRAAGGAETARCLLAAGGMQYVEFATSKTRRPGSEGLQKPAAAVDVRLGGKFRGGQHRLVIRPAAEIPRKLTEALRVDPADGIPRGLAILIPDIQPLHLPQVSRENISRSPPYTLRQYFSESAFRILIGSLRKLIAETLAHYFKADEPRDPTRKRSRAELKATIQTLGELVELCAETDPQAGAARDDDGDEETELLSTGWDPVALRSKNQAADAADLLRRGCGCDYTSRSFADWLHRGCSVGVFRFTQHTRMAQEYFFKVLRHDSLFLLLSLLRTVPIKRNVVYRGFIDPEEKTILRIACDFGGQTERASSTTPSEDDWYATNKLKAAFVVKTEELRRITESLGAAGKVLDTAEACWTAGEILHIISAPQTEGGRWRVTFGSGAHNVTGDVVCVLLAWLGNSYFWHEALRRAESLGCKNPFDAPTSLAHMMLHFEPRPASIHVACKNVLNGLLSDARVTQVFSDSDVPFDQQQRDCLKMFNESVSPLLCVLAKAGVGKTAVAQCALKVFVEKCRQDIRTLKGFGLADPGDKKIAVIGLPTRELRKDVVIELLATQVHY